MTCKEIECLTKKMAYNFQNLSSLVSWIFTCPYRLYFFDEDILYNVSLLVMHVDMSLTAEDQNYLKGSSEDVSTCWKVVPPLEHWPPKRCQHWKQLEMGYSFSGQQQNNKIFQKLLEIKLWIPRGNSLWNSDNEKHS